MVWYNNIPMIKSALLILFFLASSVGVFAQSSASVKIKNDVSSSSNSQVSSSTNIRVETNGNITTYSSDKPEDIEVKAENGKSVIKVNGVVVSASLTDGQISPTPSPVPEPTDDEEDENEGNENKNIFEVFEDLFKKVFSLLV